MMRQLPPSTNKPTDSYTRLLNHIPGMAYRCKILLNGQDFSEKAQYILTFVSKGVNNLLAMTEGDMLQANWNSIERMMNPEDLKRVREEMYDSIVAGQSYHIKYRLCLPNGTTKWIWDQGEAVFDDHGLPHTLEGLMVDISEEKFTEINLQEENRQLKATAKNLFGLGNIIGKSPGMRAVYAMILKAAQSDNNIIIYGETGCGKDLIARAIHEYSKRKGQYIPVNCGAIPEQLLESEFFGHMKGSFSGAYTNKVGYLGAADHGTLFLDELGELPLHLQVKLLRALENKMYTPVGGSTPKTSSFRLISATNQNLLNLVQEKKMRSDFYYRVNVLTITIPPLRDRKEDIPLLVEAYMERKGVRFTFPLHIRMIMERYNWPGNVRELYNFLDRYCTFGEEAASALGNGVAMELLVPENLSCLTLEAATAQLEETMIRKALEECRWRRNCTATRLGLNLRTLQRKMKRYDIHEKN